MSADRLGEAARVLRERGDAATPGPWWNDTSLHNVIFSGTGLGTDVAVTEDFDKRADADYIAMMHPGVALAFADWLDAEIERDKAFSGALGTDLPPFIPALRVADLILGRES